MRIILTVALFVASAAHADVFSLKGDAPGMSLEEWRAKHRHVSQEYQGKQSFAPMCSDTNPKNRFIQPRVLGVGEIVCERYYPYERKTITIANIEADIRYYFITNKDGHKEKNGLREIYARFESDYFQKMKGALIAKWGQPTEASSEVMTNSFGARFDGETLSWVDGESGSIMTLTQYAGSLATSTLRLSSSHLNGEYAYRAGQVPNPDADDL